MSAQVWMAKYGALRTTPEAAGNGCAQQTVSVLLEEGCTLCDQGEFDAAQACFRAVVQQCPDWAVGHNNLGWALQQSGRNEDAISSYKAAISLQPAFDLAKANLAFLLATLYGHMGQHDSARGMWKVLGELYPRDPEILEQLVSTSLRTHDLDAAGLWAAHYASVVRGDERSLSQPGACEGRGAVPRASRAKLAHDLEQLRYLRDHQLIGPRLEAEIASYEAALQPFEQPNSLATPPANVAALPPSYGRNVHQLQAPRLQEGALKMSQALLRAERDYLESPLGLVVIDDFLSADALALVQAFCLQSTIWHTDRYAHGRLGAFFREGFNCPLLLQVADEIRRCFPQLIGKHHPLLQMWGFKYQHDQPATHPHADFAAVNVNFWITPDEANLDRDSGGLVVYDVEAPSDWDFETYNRQGDRIAAFLKEAGARRTVIPYRCNRAVIFNSDLFHATAPLAFRPGYLNQRVNVTLLFGERGSAPGQ